jgi:sulfiredoxin
MAPPFGYACRPNAFWGRKRLDADLTPKRGSLPAHPRKRVSMKPISIKIEEIYVPAALRKPVDPAKVTALAESIADKGQEAPILVRPDKGRYVLVSGLHRIEACKALGETTIIANIVQSRKF